MKACSRTVLVAALVALAISACAASPLPTEQATPTSPVGVLIEGGKCCIAATAGQEISIQAAFQATASTTEMRAMAGSHPFDETALSAASWEPFSPSRVYPYTAPINWSGFYVTVQFRDASGSLSPIYSDDISVEGMPGDSGQ